MTTIITNNQSFPAINCEQAHRQLELLGYKSGDSIYLRFFYPSNDPRKDSDKGRKLDRLDWTWVEHYQQEGRGAYFVINGGGHKNEDVQSGRAFFYEHDNLDKELQRSLWQRLKLPEPTFQVDTGGKSIHSYWVLTEPIPIEQWCELQRDLLEYADADRSIKNPARVMRLAGAWHISISEAGKPIYNQSRIISDSGKTYTVPELQGALPEKVASMSLMDSRNPEDTGNAGEASDAVVQDADRKLPSSNECHSSPSAIPVIVHPDFIQLPVAESVPLLLCCRKEVRAWVASGIKKGNRRNDTAINVALELIAVERFLQSINQQFELPSRQLFSEFCQRSGMTAKEEEERWQWCEALNPTPSAGVEGVEACVRGWYWKEFIKPYRIPPLVNRAFGDLNKNQTHFNGTGDNSSTGDTSTPRALSITATVTAVTAILERGLTDWEELAELDTVAASSTISKTAFWQLVSALRCQSDEVLKEDTERVSQLIDWHNAQLDFHAVLPNLADDLIHDGRVLNIDPIQIWQYLLPAVLSLVGKKVNLDIASHIVPAIAWTCLVGESGTGKSRAEGLVLAPLKQWQAAEHARFKNEWTEHQKATKGKKKTDTEEESQAENAPPLPERKYLFEVATIQAVMRRLSEQGDNGSLWARDEIAGLFKSLGQFNKGDTEALECLLKLWDGTGAQVDRILQEDSYFVEFTRLSIAGGIQPGVFRQIFCDPNDAQGMQARFLFALPQIRTAKRVKGYCRLSDLLPSLYRWLDNQFPAGTIKLSKAAEASYDAAYELLGQQAERASTPAIRAWMRKSPGQLLRIALGLHLIECHYEPRRPKHEIQLDTLNRAMKCCRYYRSCFQVVQESVSETDSISSILLKIWDLGVQTPSGLLAREAYRNIKAIQRRAKELGRNVGAYTAELFSKLAEMGKAQVKKEGRSVRLFVKFPSPPDSGGNGGGGNSGSPPDSPIEPGGGNEVELVSSIESWEVSNQERERQLVSTLKEGFVPNASPIPVPHTQWLQNVVLSLSPHLPISPSPHPTELVSLSTTPYHPHQVAVEDTRRQQQQRESAMDEHNGLSLLSPPISHQEVTTVTTVETSTPTTTELSLLAEQSPVTVEQDSTLKDISSPVTVKQDSAPEDISSVVTNLRDISSPVTVEQDSTPKDISSVVTNSFEVSWLLSFLEDLESQILPSKRFSSAEQLIELFQQAEAIVQSCQEELNRCCPNYWERVSRRLGIICEAIPEEAIASSSNSESATERLENPGKGFSIALATKVEALKEASPKEADTSLDLALAQLLECAKRCRNILDLEQLGYEGVRAGIAPKAIASALNTLDETTRLRIKRLKAQLLKHLSALRRGLDVKSHDGFTGKIAAKSVDGRFLVQSDRFRGAAKGDHCDQVGNEARYFFGSELKPIVT